MDGASAPARLALWAAFLLGGRRGEEWRDAGAGGEALLVQFLIARRLAAEMDALPVAARLGREARRALSLERARAGALAGARQGTLERCHVALLRAGVPGMLLKGHAVVELTHRDASRRPMADLDLLVEPAHRAEVARALEAGGLTRPGADTPLHDVFLDPASAGPGAPRGVAVEVHDDVFPRPHPFEIDARGAIGRASGGTAGVHVPRLHDALALTAFSFVFHETDSRKSWLVLRDLALLAEVASRDDADAAPAGGASDIALATRRAVDIAFDWAGPRPAGGRAPADGPGPRASTWRRGLALRLALDEIRRSLPGMEPAPRHLTRRLAAALWQRQPLETARALARAATSGGGAAIASRARRLVAALAAAARGGSAAR